MVKTFPEYNEVQSWRIDAATGAIVSNPGVKSKKLKTRLKKQPVLIR
jgi:hypothetical protein